MIENYSKLLSNFKPISIDEMENVALCNRVDSKFIMTVGDLQMIFPCLLSNYYILDISGQRIFSYENNYFDTPDLQFYKDHHNGYVNRIKVRSRKYVESDLCFFEIKKKEKIERTNKLRENIPDMINEIDSDRKSIIQYYSRRKIDELDFILQNNFHRMTFVDFQHTERVTIDIDLSFEDENKSVSFGDIAIVEVKHSKNSITSPLAYCLKEHHIRKQGMSKYVYGVITLKQNVKTNNFKPLLSKLTELRSHGTR
ncbi:polyphosphate polymerase domain-containing protein [Flavobacterium sp.]|uniref:polyphosphate polymerase domain-containing protein n=1 Tax=Flavobacterium sp. TaxID=239 RepID=UPI0028BEF18A|nr:polyphosphate polymerase domain-containing protein [Flavobacterium sp.]